MRLKAGAFLCATVDAIKAEPSVEIVSSECGKPPKGNNKPTQNFGRKEQAYSYFIFFRNR